MNRFPRRTPLILCLATLISTNLLLSSTISHPSFIPSIIKHEDSTHKSFPSTHSPCSALRSFTAGDSLPQREPAHLFRTPPPSIGVRYLAACRPGSDPALSPDTPVTPRLPASSVFHASSLSHVTLSTPPRPPLPLLASAITPSPSATPFP